MFHFDPTLVEIFFALPNIHPHIRGWMQEMSVGVQDERQIFFPVLNTIVLCPPQKNQDDLPLPNFMKIRLPNFMKIRLPSFMKIRLPNFMKIRLTILQMLPFDIQGFRRK